MDSVQIKPKSSGWQKKIFAPFDIFGGDVWINGECLLNVLYIIITVLLASEYDFSLALDGLLISAPF